jgi:hypothetical protein
MQELQFIQDIYIVSIRVCLFVTHVRNLFYFIVYYFKYALFNIAKLLLFFILVIFSARYYRFI